MKITPQAKLKLLGVEFVQVNFNSKKPYSKTSKTKVDINIKPFVFYPKEDPKIFKLIMNVELVADEFFEFTLTSIGTFRVNQNIDNSIKESFVNANTPAIVFPYVRAFISTFTSNVGAVTTPILIPPQFFRGAPDVISE